MTTRGAIRRKSLPDPPRDPDAMRQLPFISLVLYLLRDHFSHRTDALVNGEGYLCRDTRISPGQLKPDCVVAFGVDPKAIEERNGYVINEVGKPPDFVLEIASRSTGRADYTTKRDGYAGYGVTEYWRFDPSGGEYHDRPLAGDTLVNGRYEPIRINAESDDVFWGRSPTLGLDLYWQDGHLRFYDPVRGEFLLEFAEVKVERDAAIEERDAERAAREFAEGRADAAEAELTRLRERFSQIEDDESDKRQ